MTELAKPCMDVGLYTNRIEDMRAFYEGELGLRFEEILPVGGGVRQHRLGLNGSVLKLNDSRDPLPDAPTGYGRLLVGHPSAPRSLRDPDGLEVELVSGSAIEVVVRAREPDAFGGLYAGIGGEQVGEAAWRVGTTTLRVERDPAAADAGAMRAGGFRYLTVQVRDVRGVHERLVGAGVREGMAPIRMGDVAMISFVRDPGGNWIEISQRASLTGPLP